MGRHGSALNASFFRHRNVRYHFYSNEGAQREPVHIHAKSSGGEAKFWLYSKVTIARGAGFSQRQLKKLAVQISRH